MYDFIVVGAGPPGSRFAYQTARAGHDVLLLEKGTIGEPLACSGHVSTDIWGYLPEEAQTELLQNEISGARFHTGSANSRAYPFYKDETISHVIDRVQLDKQLAQRAQDAGADVRESHNVTNVVEYESHVDVTAVTGRGQSETFSAHLVAGCDGPTSRVRRAAELPEPDELLHGVLAFSDEVDAGNYVDVHLTAPSFFAWRIPRGDAGVEYGVAAPPSTGVSELFTDLTSAYNVTSTHRCSGTIPHRCSGTIPIGPPESVTTDRIFLIGDAAAQTKPFTGGGILYSLTAADIAAKTISPTDLSTLSAYETTWRDALLREIRLGMIIRRCYSLPRPLQRIGLRMLSGKIGVHMDHPSSFFSRKNITQLLTRD